MGQKLLEVNNLSVEFSTPMGVVKAVANVSWSLERGEILAIVGESGSGKSVTALSILQLITTPPGRIVSGEVLFNNQDLLQLSEDSIRYIRGRKISMVFQEPMIFLKHQENSFNIQSITLKSACKTLDLKNEFQLKICNFLEI